MNNWEYDELIEAVKENFNSFSRGNLDIGQAAERCFYEFESSIKEGYCESVIIHSTLGLLLSSGNKISKRQFDKIMTVLNVFESSKVSDQLKHNEADKLKIQVDEVKQLFTKLEII